MSESALEGIAIIGVHGRFPGAEGIDAFWNNLVSGRECISTFSDAELAAAGLDPQALRQAGKYVPARGVLAGADLFDAGFFGIQPKEAEVMDPQHRVFLEACWEALERVGYASGRGAGAVGIYAGASNNTYYLHALHGRPELRELVGADQVMLGNEKDYLATRVAYKLGLRGPAISLNTACSSSLVSVCLAQQALLTYQCDLAVAGGVSILVPQQRGYYFQEGSIGSPDGHTRTFDAQAGGVVPGNGVTLVVLKRLEDAVADGDRIYAVIKGAALNNDGSQRAGFGAPGIEGQSEAIALAQDIAGFHPDTLSYIEAHGTATPIGDPIEIASLTKAFRRKTARKQFCAIGSVKTNIGHLDAAAGTAGLIKASLSLFHRQLPPSLHFTQPNPKLDLENSPFFVNARLRDWNTEPGIPRRAGVSSFGIGGTNCHVVLEEAPLLPSAEPGRPDQVLVLSAKTPEALAAMGPRLAAHLRAHAEIELADVAFTLQLGRSEFVHRRAVVADSAAEAAEILEQADSGRSVVGKSPGREPAVVFLFPGQGAQYVGMGAEVYRREPVFAAIIDRGAEVLRPILGVDLRQLLFAPESERVAADQQLRQTRFTQPSLFLIEYAFARLWMSWGIQPSAMLGHSVGEYVAACVAGVFPMEAALRLVARRAELVQAQAPGTMLAVRLPEAELVPLLTPDLAIAAINAPGSCVASGPEASIAALEARVAGQKVAHKRLATSHAFHSAMMDPVVEPYTELLRQTPMAEPQVPYVSNVTARWVTPAEATSPEYWAGHVRQTVRFSEGLALLLEDPQTLFIEAGPSQTLAQLVRQHPGRKPEQTVVSSLGVPAQPESVQLRLALGRAWVAGARVDWKAYHGESPRRRVELPTYPFQRRRYWPEAAESQPVAAASPRVLPAAPDAPKPARGPGPIPLTAAPSAAVSTVPAAPVVPRRERLLDLIRALLRDLSGAELDAGSDTATFLELGLDSLLLTQAATQFQRKFGVPVSFRQLQEDLSTTARLADYLDAQLPADRFQPTPPPAPSSGLAAAGPATLATQLPLLTAAVASAPAGTLSSPQLVQLLEQQLQLTAQLLAAVRAQAGGAASPVTTSPAPSPSGMATTSASVPTGESHGPFRPADRGTGASFTESQQAFLGALIERYTRRTAGSKRLAAQNRKTLADPRSAAGFKDVWKEMVYPLYTERSDGARVWDVDGNEYVDFVMGFGANLFGHRPRFVVEAIEHQLAKGFEVGPIQPMVGEAAALASEMTGMERVAFCNTGSEAVLAAMRLARTVTGRDTIGVFSGAYHGVFDEVLVRPLRVNGEVRSAPIAPGIPASSVSQIRVYDWANPTSLELIRQHAHELAAVLVEPVQSRRLDVQPHEFLHELRRLTQELGITLIFDEVVTGFRFHPGGAQAWYGIRADLASYGKVIGGGLPIGLVAGAARFMDALDGGAWQFGDGSFPEVGVTFFAGTFVRHPITIAVAKAVLDHLKREGPSLQERVSALAARTAERLREVIARHAAPLRIAQASSMMYLTLAPEFRWGGLVFYLLRERGLHVWENRAIVFTTAHGDDDANRLVQALDESLVELEHGGFLPLARTAAGTAPTSAPTRALPETARTPVAVSAGSAEVFGLTDAQREVWLAALLDERASRSYNLTFQIRLRGPLDVEALRRSLQRWMDRHDSLRTTFDLVEARQRVLPRLDVPWEIIDRGEVAESARAAAAEALARTQADETFDLTRAPLLRLALVRFADVEHVLLLTVSHLVADGWSFGVLLHELKVSYGALREGRVPELEPALQYAQYRTLLDGEGVRTSTAKSEAFWQQRFASLPVALDLPADRVRPGQRSFAAGRVTVRWNRDFVRTLKQASAKQGVTLLVYLLAGFKSLLRRLSGQEDLVVGLPAAGQIATSLEEPAGARALVGHCVHLLPIRTTCDVEATFAAYLKTVRAEILDAFEHQDLTFGRLVELLQMRRDPSRVPLAPIMFNLDRAPAGFQLAGLETEISELPRRSLVFDLSINAVDNDVELTLDCDFNADLFEATTVARWMEQFRVLLESAVAEPGLPISRLAWLDASQRRLLLEDWNATQVAYPEGQTVHGWIREQVRRTPDAVAVVFGNERLTYAELDRRSDMLAEELRRQGVGVETLVGIYVERSLDLVVGVLGVLKAGGAYVPLDPAFPRERLAFMVEDAGLPVIVTQSAQVPELPPHQARVVTVDTLPAKSSQGAPALEERSGPDHLAYVIYTSGSTGKPKGVEVLHRGVVNFLNAMRREPGFAANDVLLAVTTLSFDIAGLELYLPLVCGGTVVIARRETAADGEQLAAELRRHAVTFMQATPTTWRLLLAAGWKGDAKLKILCGGEAFPPDLARQLLPCCGSLWNVYGPTETTIWSTCLRVTAEDATGPISIGRPIDNTTLYLLDAHQEPVPIGVAGELMIGGDGLARGYRGRPELTRERFVPHPFLRATGERLYRTGDLARWLPDGRVQFLGRLDHQVKLRGYRIELGEIESVVTRHAGVGQCVALVREDVPGDARLVAYVEPGNGRPVDPTALRQHVRGFLPEYMVPQHFVVVPSLPLTPNGKIDRRALPAPEGGSSVAVTEASRGSAGDSAAEPPTTPTEIALAELWKKVLGVRTVTRASNFFDLGGHSLLAVRLFAEIEKTLGCKLPLATILRAETLLLLAAEVESVRGVPAAWQCLVPVRPRGERPPFFCVHGAGGEVLFARDLVRHFAPDQPFYGLQARGVTHYAERDGRVEEMAERYLREITTRQPAGPYYLGGFCMGGLVAYEMAQRLRQVGREVRLVVMIDSYNPTEAALAAKNASGFTIWREKLGFHWGNLRGLPSEERGTYFRRRFQAMVQGRAKRLWGKVSLLTTAGEANGGEDSGARLSMESFNDEVGMAYRPAPYDGDVFLVRPQTGFSFFNDPQMGWGGYVRGRLEVESIPVNPGGMLVEPFVGMVGDRVSAALARAQQTQ